MSTIAKLFGRSPFNLLQRHMDQVGKCAVKMGEALDAFERGAFEQLQPLANEVSRLEHEADQIRDDIRNHILRRFFMPVNRGQVLRILSQQDSLADIAEDVCVLLTMKKLTIPAGLKDSFRKFREVSMQALDLVGSIVDELDELMETGFGGAEAEKIRGMARDVAFAEHEADVVAHELVRGIYALDTEMSIGEFHLWMRLTATLSGLSNTAENLADSINMILDAK
ncbi:MAG: TIGR00153 family protein [Planctomycetota bacterium]|nr:TIGR00153 family protein [Planctomycetota bacterium]